MPSSAINVRRWSRSPEAAGFHQRCATAPRSTSSNNHTDQRPKHSRTMCGICVIWNRAAMPVDRDLLRHMTDEMMPRDQTISAWSSMMPVVSVADFGGWPSSIQSGRSSADD